MKALASLVGWLLIISFPFVFGVFLVNYQFQIYKKKHGEQMTFMDFLFDAEVK